MQANRAAYAGASEPAFTIPGVEHDSWLGPCSAAKGSVGHGNAGRKLGRSLAEASPTKGMGSGEIELYPPVSGN